MKPKKHLIVVGGPTASGKTSMAIRLAQHYQTSILSADSRQFYRQMSIGTAKPTAEELNQATHHFINSHSIQQNYNVGDFEKEALDLLDQLFAEKDIVLLTGGSGLYINALCQGLDTFPEVPNEIRDRLEKILEQEGITRLQSMLQSVDPAYAERVDQHNPHRLIRALSVYEASGKPFSWYLQQKSTQRPFETIYVQLQWDRTELYDRINRRVDLMVAAGLLDEVKSLKAYRGQSALATVGYQEIFDYLDGIHDWETAVELIKRNSRRYAKRQLTWMRRDGFWKQFPNQDSSAIIAYIDWCISTSNQLHTTYNSDKTKQVLQFVYLEKVIASLDVTIAKYYDYALIQASQDQQALEYLLEEWLNRSRQTKHYLFSSTSLELFTDRFGFLPIEATESLPSYLVEKWPPGTQCFLKEEDE